jgi:hypothetical protein
MLNHHFFFVNNNSMNPVYIPLYLSPIPIGGFSFLFHLSVRLFFNKT